MEFSTAEEHSEQHAKVSDVWHQSRREKTNKKERGGRKAERRKDWQRETDR